MIEHSQSCSKDMKREITLTSIILSTILTILLGAANAYLGLKVGITISASIPAAILSMGILRLMNRSSILENNIVQTAASAGEALTAGVAFTLPALLFTGVIQEFTYWQTVLLSLIGGTLGVVFAVPLRRALIRDPKLAFPEGTAIAKVLQSESTGSDNLGLLLKGGAISSLIALLQNGLKVLSSSVESWFQMSTTIVGFQLGLSPTLIGAGFIIGTEIGIAILIGIVIAWFGILPYMAYQFHESHTLNTLQMMHYIWENYIRFVGVGCLLGAGLWSVVELIYPFAKQFLRRVKQYEHTLIDENDPTNQDIPPRWLFFIGAIFLGCAYLYLYKELQIILSEHSNLLHHVIALVGTGSLLIIGFIVSAIIAYIVGMIGTSASPLSGLTLVALIIIGVCLSSFTVIAHKAMLQITLILTVMIASTAAISNDTMQDLKTGDLIGATPWKQEIMLMFGVLVSSLTIPVILKLLYDAYGFAQHLPRPGMNPETALLAPQANLMATVAEAILSNKVPWDMLLLGLGLAAAGLILNAILKQRNRRFPVLGMGLGIYLPLVASTPLMIGGLSHYFLKRYMKKVHPEAYKKDDQRLLLFACGMVAGAALIGVFLAVPFVIFKSTDCLRLMPVHLEWLGDMLSIFMLVALYLYARKLTRAS